MGKFNFGYLVAVAFLIGSLVFLSPSITGHAVAGVEEEGTSFLSIILFVAGVATFVFFKRKSKV
jgi:xanthine/uracil permease